MKAKKTHVVVGIDIGSSTSKMCAVIHYEDPETPPELVGLVEVESFGIYKGNIVDEKEVLETIFNLVKDFSENPLSRKSHTILSLNAAGISSISNSGSIINSSIDNQIGKLDLDRLEKEVSISVANIRNKKIIHTIPVRYRVDSNEVEIAPIGLFGKRIEGKFLFVFSPVLYVERLENILKKMKIKIEDVVAGPFAESLVLLNKRQREAGTALINFGHSTTSIIVYENNKPILSSILGCGSNDITNDIALGLQISLEEAENIKIGKSDISFSKRKVEEIIEARIEHVCEKINLELDKINRRELLPGGIILTGGGSKLIGIDHMFRDSLKLPVKFANQDIRDFSNGQLLDSCYARVYGLTYLAPIVSSNYSVSRYINSIFKNLKSFLARLLP